MANYKNWSDEKVVAEAIGINVTADEHRIKYSQTVSEFICATIAFSEKSILIIIKAAKSCQLGSPEELFVIGTILLKFNFMAMGVEPSVRFEAKELQIIEEWLNSALAASIYNNDERFDALMLWVQLQKTLQLKIVESPKVSNIPLTRAEKRAEYNSNNH